MSTPNSDLSWTWRTFDELSLNELYAIIALRVAVFVVEQDCPYQEADQKDQPALHLMGHKDGELMAYSRVLPPGVSYNEVAVGRVVVHPEHRYKRWGHALMAETMAGIDRQYGSVPVRISAQEHLKQYYAAFGFEQVSDMYLEDGIPHIEMLSPAPA